MRWQLYSSRDASRKFRRALAQLLAEAKAPLALKSLEIRALIEKVREQSEGVERKGWRWKSDPGSPLASTSHPSAETSTLGVLELLPVAGTRGAGWCQALGITPSPRLSLERTAKKEQICIAAILTGVSAVVNSMQVLSPPVAKGQQRPTHC